MKETVVGHNIVLSHIFESVPRELHHFNYKR